jgi:hypothetical protein
VSEIGESAGKVGMHANVWSCSDQKGAHVSAVELPSPTLGRQEFVAELDGGPVAVQEKRL